MGQALLKEVPKLKEWPDFSCEGEYYGMEFIRFIEVIKEYFELPERLVTETFNTFFPKSAHKCYIKLRQGHQHQSWNWWKTQIINIWATYSWRVKGETAFEYSKFNDEKGRTLPWFCQQKDRLTALHPDTSEFRMNQKILKQCAGELENAIKGRTTEQSPEEEILNILYEVTCKMCL
ncbi:hypothetical protein O181_106566 [Austropuccinia psidii MF-1]|uniref:Uncharacterized protein n=1 Tax=Austropuccinia psidii MF-1 TaxID=1389203 RepID=A0A9Q3JR81_9BASI|nr:hypothetical protein [Austropuccinia psidii MF-1]